MVERVKSTAAPHLHQWQKHQARGKSKRQIIPDALVRSVPKHQKIAVIKLQTTRRRWRCRCTAQTFTECISTYAEGAPPTAVVSIAIGAYAQELTRHSVLDDIMLPKLFVFPFLKKQQNVAYNGRRYPNIVGLFFCEGGRWKRYTPCFFGTFESTSHCRHPAPRAATVQLFSLCWESHSNV